MFAVTQNFTAKLFQYVGTVKIPLLMLKGFVPIFNLNFTNFKLQYNYLKSLWEKNGNIKTLYSNVWFFSNTFFFIKSNISMEGFMFDKQYFPSRKASK